MSLFRFFILSVLIFILFGCQKNREVQVEENLAKLKGIIENLETQGQQMSSDLDQVAHYYQALIEKKDSILRNPGPFKYTMDGPFSVNLPEEDSTLSSIIILNTTKDRKKAEEEVLLTNSLDSVFASFFRKNPMAVQIYSNSALQVSRVYPAYDTKNIVDPNIDVTTFNFYYEADRERNPSKGLVWIPDAYVDPAGKGWILSLVHPVYDGEELFAVLGVDFTVSDVIHNYLESVQGNFVLVNSKGDIVAGKGEAIEALSMPPLKNHVYRETIQSDNFRISDFNLFQSKSPEVRKMAQTFLLERRNQFNFKEEANLKSALCLSFQGIDWYLIELFPNY
ncbi:hypothetical protein [Algoriphagus sp. AK58]|uniref:hypothetical protein n=1 Tax=Algoriphagus sp. AK58 TaxID=1406877 RepID=UPI00164FE5E4|nr:hypothetical protein [Algoriphagus sp. AK58]MBC6365169.1 hypothetical protein [Algoriphagus sp. AK58]